MGWDGMMMMCVWCCMECYGNIGKLRKKERENSCNSSGCGVGVGVGV